MLLCCPTGSLRGTGSAPARVCRRAATPLASAQVTVRELHQQFHQLVFQLVQRHGAVGIALHTLMDDLQQLIERRVVQFEQQGAKAGARLRVLTSRRSCCISI